MKVIYIAGRFRGKDGWEVHCNVHAAECAARQVAALGAVPVTPHSIGAHMDRTETDKFWLGATKELMLRCDAVLVVPGWETSEGTRGEIDAARARGIPVFLPEWHSSQPNIKSLEHWLTTES